MTILSFIGNSQLCAIKSGLRGEEKQYFVDTVKQINATVATMPKTYEQDGKGEEAIAYLHYFTSGCDWYITERDQEDEQHQAFGMADLGYGGELGYISIVELLQNGAELDFHFTPRALKLIKEKTKPEAITAGRTWPSLKEGKTFDSERLAGSPLFDRRLF